MVCSTPVTNREVYDRVALLPCHIYPIHIHTTVLSSGGVNEDVALRTRLMIFAATGSLEP